jgi:hemolysin III
LGVEESASPLAIAGRRQISFNIPMPAVECPLIESHPRTNSHHEELANTISHCVGLIAAAIGMPLLVIAAWRSGSAGLFAGTIVFAVTVLILYLVSMLYHAWPESRAKRTLQLLDHCAIFLLIAGTYTPFSLGPLRGVWGLILLGTIWLFAIFGIILKAIRGPSRDRWLGLFCYLGMGWSALIVFRPLVLQLPGAVLLWLIAGGVAYTAGVLFFVNERMRYAHFVWHLFVLAGTGCHCLAVLACSWRS